MKTKTIIGFSIIFILTSVLLWAQPITAQNCSYAPGLYPNAFSTPKLHWRITNVTDEVVEFGFGSGKFWRAQEGQALTFEIQEIANDELYGLCTIGNLTLPVNDSQIAAELVFSIWPWFPGLISHLDWNTVDQDATDAAATFFMNGSLDITTTSTTKSYVYHQGPWGNQNTTLVYDLGSGILLSAYTEFFFLNDYHLGIEFITLTQTPTSLTTFVFVVIFAVVLMISMFCIIVTRLRSRRTKKRTAAIRVALIAVLAALAIGGNYALSAVPNIELSSVMVFLSGFLFGPIIGALVAFIAMLIYQLWNPWGAFIPPIGLAVIGCTIVIGIVGGILGKAMQGLDYSDSSWFLLPILFGVLLTLFFDLVTNFAYCFTFGIPFIVVLITGLPFMMVHIPSNAILFLLLTQPVTQAVHQLQLNQHAFPQHTIKTKKEDTPA
ncbi:MAG: ECF transporter S component [Promethearchaeota archaeon]